MTEKLWNDLKPLSSDVDWCEANYATIPIIAEFWNTVSNAIFFVIPPLLIYLFKQYRQQVCGTVNVVWVLLIIVGVGSVFFHSTLSLIGQLIDELAILWVCMAAIATWLPNKYLPSFIQNKRKWFQIGIYASAVLISFLSYLKPELNHVFLFLFMPPGIALLFKELKLCNCPKVQRVGKTSAIWLIIAVTCWVSDRFMCPIWAEVLHFPYLHSAWHITVCLAAYLSCVCFAYFYAASEVPEQCPTIKFWPHDSHTWFGIPYVALLVAGTKPIKAL